MNKGYVRACLRCGGGAGGEGVVPLGEGDIRGIPLQVRAKFLGFLAPDGYI
jgi:hypothetical protein